MCLWSAVFSREARREGRYALRRSISLGSRPLGMPVFRRCETMVRSPPQSGHVADSRRAEAGMDHAEGRAGRAGVFRVCLARTRGWMMGW
jgi:hypothetical protein